MNIKVFVWQITEVEQELLKVILNAALDSDVFIIYELKDIPRYEIVPTDIILCFGIRAFNIIQSQYSNAIKLPLLSALKNIPENKEARSEAWAILQHIKNQQQTLKKDLQLELKPEDLAVNLTTQSNNLARYLNEDKTEYWIGTTSLGKKVLISQSYNNTLSCNFQLTFEELYAAKLAIDLLGLTSLTLVKGKKDD